MCDLCKGAQLHASHSLKTALQQGPTFQTDKTESFTG